MASQKELDLCYMSVAESHARLSKGERLKVGCALVTGHGVILGGYNGLAPGSSNILEYSDENGELVTKPEVIHAELNTLLKAAKEGVSVIGSTLYTTTSCCLPCAEMIAASGVIRVVYRDLYRSSTGCERLIELGVDVEQISE